MALHSLNSMMGWGIGKDQILERIRQGDEKALEILYKQHYRMMVRLVMRNSGTEEEAKDIYQEALVSLWKKIRSENLIIHSKISTYLYGVCLNLWRKELSRKKRLVNKEEDGIEYMDNQDLEYKKIVSDSIHQLDPTCRKVLMYHYFDGLSMQELADAMGFANSDTAKAKKYKCKDKLKKLIEMKYTKEDLLD